jgi:hypothetical protein
MTLRMNLSAMSIDSVLGRLVALISSKSRVYLLENRHPDRRPVSRSVGLTKRTVLIGRTGSDTMTSIPDPTQSKKNSY